MNVTVFKSQGGALAAELCPTGKMAVTKPLALAPLGGLGKRGGLASQYEGRLEQMGREHGSLHEKETKAEPGCHLPEATSSGQFVAPFWVHTWLVSQTLIFGIFLIASKLIPVKL